MTLPFDPRRIGRNEACPCGAGEKFKKCCGAPERLAHTIQAAGDKRIADRLLAAAQAEASGAIDKAIEALDEESVLRTDPVAMRMRLARLLRHRARSADAILQLEAAHRLAPARADLAKDLVDLLIEQGRAPAALQIMAPLVAAHPADVEAICLMAMALGASAQWPQAVAWYERAARLSPNNGALLNNLGNALRRAGRTGDALGVYVRAADAHPDLEAVYGNMAQTLMALGRADDALHCYANRLATTPRDHSLFSDLLLTMQYSDRVTPAQVATAHRRYAEQIENPLVATRQPHVRDRNPDRPLRIGFVSSDLRAHSVAHFMEPVVQHHDRERFVFFAYATSTAEDEVAQRLKSGFEVWRSVGALDHEALSRSIHEDCIDVLVDLNGHTAGNRLPVFARKPAPVQVSWLGYPNTTGLQAIDYRITDALADPPGLTESLHSEQLWRLPTCFVCYRPPALTPAGFVESRSAGRVVFGSFNNHRKYSDSVIATWSRILLAVPESTLALRVQAVEDASIHAALAARFARWGVAADRLRFLPDVDAAADHLARYEQIDVALDTFPYAGTTTTCDALWMGVPVVTLAGAVHASRVGCSLLSAVGLPELVCDGVDRYVALAVELALGTDRRQALRRELRHRMARSPLTDGEAFTSSIESAWRAMWATWCRDQTSSDMA
jgi:predicted O-linked N-acetylglucosamine transferase (SPINDLY family)